VIDNLEPGDRRRRRALLLTLIFGVASFVCLWPLVFITINAVPRWMHSARTRAISDVLNIDLALTDYTINNAGTYPSSLAALLKPDTNGNCYLACFDWTVPKDPWKHEYQFEPPTREHPKPHVWSWGADGKPGGTGEDADIDSDRLADSER